MLGLISAMSAIAAAYPFDEQAVMQGCNYNEGHQTRIGYQTFTLYRCSQSAYVVLAFICLYILDRKKFHNIAYTLPQPSKLCHTFENLSVHASFIPIQN